MTDSQNTRSTSHFRSDPATGAAERLYAVATAGTCPVVTFPRA